MARKRTEYLTRRKASSEQSLAAREENELRALRAAKIDFELREMISQAKVKAQSETPVVERERPPYVDSGRLTRKRNRQWRFSKEKLFVGNEEV